MNIIFPYPVTTVLNHIVKKRILEHSACVNGNAFLIGFDEICKN